MKILLIEDDTSMALFIRKGLREAGHVVEHAANGVDGLFLAETGNFDVLVVDRMLSGGFDSLRMIEVLRCRQDDTPILIVSARAAVPEKVAGLRAGADDYLAKPFAFTELLARVEALGRRPSIYMAETMLRVADLELDLLSRTVSRADRQISMPPSEFRLLELLMRHAGRVVTRSMLLEKIWDYHFDPQTNVIDVSVCRLRRKLEVGIGAPLIQTIRNAGYMLRVES